MFLDLKNIGPAGFRFDRKVPVPDLEGACGEKVVVRSASLAGEVTKAAGGYELEGKLLAVVDTDCSRCLEPVSLAIESEIELRLVPSEIDDEAVKEEVVEDDLDEEDEALRFECPEGRADLIQLVSEQLYLALPLKPVCREGCKGLCPNCGVNRNEVSCGCQEAWIDPRLAPLQQLRDHLK
jgi:uncharacterized protein